MTVHFNIYKYGTLLKSNLLTLSIGPELIGTKKWTVFSITNAKKPRCEVLPVTLKTDLQQPRRNTSLNQYLIWQVSHADVKKGELCLEDISYEDLKLVLHWAALKTDFLIKLIFKVNLDNSGNECVWKHSRALDSFLKFSNKPGVQLTCNHLWIILNKDIVLLLGENNNKYKSMNRYLKSRNKHLM